MHIFVSAIRQTPAVVRTHFLHCHPSLLLLSLSFPQHLKTDNSTPVPSSTPLHLSTFLFITSTVFPQWPRGSDILHNRFVTFTSTPEYLLSSFPSPSSWINRKEVEKVRGLVENVAGRSTQKEPYLWVWTTRKWVREGSRKRF